MPRARSPESVEAEKRYKAGEKPIDIAHSMNVPYSTVRRWKSTQDWDGKKKKANTPGKTSKAKPKTAKPKKPRTVKEKLAAKVEENEELTAQQKEFCLHYVQIFNAVQAYIRVYDCKYSSAAANAYRLMEDDRIKTEIAELKKIKNEHLFVTADDVVAMHMKIAFSDMRDYVDFSNKTVPVLRNGEVLMMKNPKTGAEVPVTRSANIVKMKDAAYVDGQLITEVSEGREGAKIKLADRHKSLAFLERYFSLNPTDRHRREYMDKRYELDLMRVEVEHQMIAESEESSDNFLDAMMQSAEGVWDDVETDIEAVDDADPDADDVEEE